jgi:hypothetical protein
MAHEGVADQWRLACVYKVMTILVARIYGEKELCFLGMPKND